MPPARTHFCEVVARDVVAALDAQKDVLELVHPRVGKQQRGIVGRNKRRAVHPAVPLRLKKLQKGLTNFGA